MSRSLAEKSVAAEAAEQESAYRQRACYHSSENNFEFFSWPPVPSHQFVEERHRAFDAHTPTGLIPLDLSQTLQVSILPRRPRC